MDVNYIHKVCTQPDRKEQKIFILGLSFQLIIGKNNNNFVKKYNKNNKIVIWHQIMITCKSVWVFYKKQKQVKHLTNNSWQALPVYTLWHVKTKKDPNHGIIKT